MSESLALLWLRRDLRLHDHPALCAALRSAQAVVPVYCLDERLLSGNRRSPGRVGFMLDCLRELRDALVEAGSGLVVRHGRPEEEIPRLARELGACEVHYSFDVTPFAARRDRAVSEALAGDIRAIPHPGVLALEDLASLQAGEGVPYTVFTPFYRAWLRRSRRRVEPAPERLPPLPDRLEQGAIPGAPSVLGQAELVERPRAGERAARAAAERWLSGPVDSYAEERNLLGRHDSASRLSPYLRFGCLSARELEEQLGESTGQEAFVRQLAWRDFYGYILHHFPGNAHQEHQVRFRTGLEWRRDDAALESWKQGLTGFPLVDAGMRQLKLEGWMHNRVRLVVGSFLTKDLGIDWREGEAHFMRLLLDGDPASNNGNWQWIASVGVDPAPAFRRMFNPARQQQRFDPEGEYVRRYVPELRPVPSEHLAEPWLMPAELQQRAGCVIGTDYPTPIVDHAAARRAALARYAAA